MAELVNIKSACEHWASSVRLLLLSHYRCIVVKTENVFMPDAFLSQ